MYTEEDAIAYEDGGGDVSDWTDDSYYDPTADSGGGDGTTATDGWDLSTSSWSDLVDANTDPDVVFLMSAIANSEDANSDPQVNLLMQSIATADDQQMSQMKALANDPAALSQYWSEQFGPLPSQQGFLSKIGDALKSLSGGGGSGGGSGSGGSKSQGQSTGIGPTKAKTPTANSSLVLIGIVLIVVLAMRRRG